MKAAVVVPTNRPERMQEFCTAWEEQLNQPDVRFIVVEDGPTLTSGLPLWVEHHCWGSIDAQLGEKARCIGRKSGAVRSFGFWLAAQDESVDMIVSLDDDVRPPQDYPGYSLCARYREQFEKPVALRWYNTMKGDYWVARGVPYTQQAQTGGVKPMLVHGLWIGSPDIDAYTQLRHAEEGALYWEPDFESEIVPPGQHFPLCSMNYAFRREVAPYAFLPPPPDGMRRWNDIWSGIVFKRLADLHGWAVTSGYPCVRHERASDPVANLRQEMLGYGLNERLWQVVDRVQKAATALSTYRAITVAIRNEFPELAEMADAMWTWSTLWSDTATPEARVVRLAGHDPDTHCSQCGRTINGESVGTCTEHYCTVSRGAGV